MTRTRLTCLGLLLAAVPANICLATSAIPTYDRRIVALDLRTGKELWEHIPDGIQEAALKLYKQGLVVEASFVRKDAPKVVYLNPDNGKPIAAFEPAGGDLIVASFDFYGTNVKLKNGWALDGFLPGTSTGFKFINPDTHRLEWQLATRGYPHRAAAFENLFFYAFGVSDDDGIYAFQAGESKPAWEVHLNRIVTGSDQPVKRISMQLIDDVIYVACGESSNGNNHHVIAIEARTGKVIWHRDLVKDLGLEIGTPYDHFHNLAAFAKSGDVLVIVMPRLVVALDLKQNRYLWRLRPDQFCGPVIHKGRVFLVLGKNRTVATTQEAKGR